MECTIISVHPHPGESIIGSMSKVGVFWALLKAAAAIDRPAWRPAKINVFRKTALRFDGKSHSLIQHIGLTHLFGHPPKLRMDFHLDEVQPGDRIAQTFIRSAMAFLPRSCLPEVRDGKVFVGFPLKSIQQIDATNKGLTLALAGASPRQVHMAMPATRWSRRRIDHLMKHLRQGGPRVWTPDYACFRKRCNFLSCGFRWSAQYEGLWNEYDDKPLSLVIATRDTITRRDWRRIVESGFVESITADLERKGFSISMRARLSGRSAFFQFAKNVEPRKIESEARQLLAWRIPTPFRLRPADRPSSKLYFDA
jgi:hypothetical protein